MSLTLEFIKGQVDEDGPVNVYALKDGNRVLSFIQETPIDVVFSQGATEVYAWGFDK